MKVASPAEWFERQAGHWDSMSRTLRDIIAFCAVELMVLGVLALYYGGV